MMAKERRGGCCLNPTPAKFQERRGNGLLEGIQFQTLGRTRTWLQVKPGAEHPRGHTGEVTLDPALEIPPCARLS